MKYEGFVSAREQTPDSPEEQHRGEDLDTQGNTELGGTLEEAAAIANPTAVSNASCCQGPSRFQDDSQVQKASTTLYRRTKARDRE